MAWIRVSCCLGAWLVAGCVVDPGPSSAGTGTSSEALQGFEVPGRLPLDADLAAPPRGSVSFWIMGDEWRVDVQAPLYRGAEAEIQLAPERLPRCGGSGTVTAFLRPDAGETLEVPLWPDAYGGPLRGAFVVPERARVLEAWTLAEGPDGCVEYDSDHGRNYRVPVHLWAPTTVRFEADWSERPDGPLLRGGVLAVAYDHDRLPDCRVVYRGFPGWDIIAHASFDGVEVPGHSVVRATGDGPAATGREPALALFAIPWDAERVELWFENRQYPPTCQGWDSDFGRNYAFPLVGTEELRGPPGARLVFGPGWHEHATAPLFAGAEIELEASPERFPGCGVAGLVTAGVRLDDGRLASVPLDETTARGSRVGRLHLPEGTRSVELWLRALGPDGCEEHDSDLGRNYAFPVRSW